MILLASSEPPYAPGYTWRSKGHRSNLAFMHRFDLCAQHFILFHFFPTFSSLKNVHKPWFMASPENLNHLLKPTVMLPPRHPEGVSYASYPQLCQIS